MLGDDKRQARMVPPENQEGSGTAEVYGRFMDRSDQNTDNPGQPKLQQLLGCDENKPGPSTPAKNAANSGPHWMVLWPFDAKAAGLSTGMRDAGTMVMFAGTPYAHLHICGSPWDGNEYHRGDRGIWTMKYEP